MTVETSRKILKVIGILSIIFGALAVILIAVLLLGIHASEISGEFPVPVSQEELRIMKLASVFGIILWAVTFLRGIFSVRAAKSFEKVMPAWVFSIIVLLLTVADAVWSILNSVNVPRTIAIAAVQIALSILVLGAANKIKKHVGK